MKVEKKKVDRKMLAVYVDADLIERLDRVARAARANRSVIIRQAINAMAVA